MRPTKLSLYELFERSRRYAVPLFQRPYVWTREAQWEPLWDDIQRKAVEMYERREARPHFLGAVVLSQGARFGRELDVSDIIDGQQRLTTSQVFLAAFRDVVRETDEARLTEELVRLTKNVGVFDREYEEFKVWPTNADRAVFEVVMRAGSLAALEAKYPRVFKRRKLQARPPLVEAYCFFHEAIRAFASSSPSDATDPAGVWPAEAPPGGEGAALDTKRLFAVFDALRRLFHLVVIELEREDDPQVIFETLNARGVPLLPSDLIRNFVFLRADRLGENAELLYRKWWAEYDERPDPASGAHSEKKFWKVMERQGRLRRPRLDLFFIHYLTSILGREVTPAHLFEDFRDRWELESGRPVEPELRTMRTYSDVFGGFFGESQGSRMERLLVRLRTLDTSTVYPLLLHLLVERGAELTDAARTQIATDLESFLVRRMICGLTTKNYNRVFLSILRDLTTGAVPATDVIRSSLLAGTGDAARWPSDADFERAWLAHPAYAWLKPKRTAMVLMALEAELRSRFQEDIALKETPTVEHVMPQAWREHWTPPAPLPAADEPDAETAEDRRDRLLHSFGNLTLLTGALNTSVSNGPFDAKRAEIALQSALRMNAAFQTATSWDEEVILARGKTLFAIARALWPKPST